ncbi:MAG: hypothetical protein EPO52_11150 [Herbiconiux sp.]|uniref:hypothetical protein n=1 Tax=Herbiconiux sp. TaxID=1871186 RepID=UPI001211D32D|nr:hypothetical protein [Herbiconiux sp.]TAJ48659.1 MAG: hypothetical protein EPO52_11150 [Herbiconiux sp.]
MTTPTASAASTASTVHVEPADPLRAAAAAAALAALPLSFTEAGRDAKVIVVAGSGGWVDRVRAAASAGAQGVIVTDPLPAPGASALATDTPACIVVLAETWASSPMLRAAVHQFGEPIARTRLIDARSVEPTTGRDLPAVIFAQLRAVQSLGIEVSTLAIAAQSTSSILAIGRSASGARIVLSAARGDGVDGTLDLLLVAADEVIRIDLPDSRTARPGRAVLTSATAAVELPTIWETAHRNSWRALHDALESGLEPGHIAMFAAALAVAPALAEA